ncbi:MAG TPA: acylneuraminate cytidylyltransferase family protein [Rhodospirillales bacterium]|nr:acylneuraminate cytidylyltransferase family protein [Rhodospirillales bacterium]
MWRDEAVLAVIPARGGSKGIPGKNLRRVGPWTLIEWTARLVRELPWIDRALLSTDDPEIAEEGRRVGLEVPFLRPAELATDTAAGVDVWRHAWLAAEALHGAPFPLSVYLQPTTPLRRPEEVTRTIDVLVAGGFAAATTVAPVPGHFLPEKILRLDARGCLHPFLDRPAVANRQEAPRYYWRTGAAYAARRRTVVEEGRILGPDCAGVVVETFTPNIDDPVDLDFAEFLHRRSSGSDG